MGLIDKRRTCRQFCRQSTHFLAIVVENPGVAEFHSRLNDQPDDVLPSGEQAMCPERGAKDVQSAINIFDHRRGGTFPLCHFSARRRDLRSDDVKRSRRTSRHLLASFFRSSAQSSSAFRDGLLIENLHVVTTRHARVQVDLLISRMYAKTSQIAGLRHGCSQRFTAPSKRTQVVSSKQNATCWQSRRSGGNANCISELPRRHTRISAELVNLAGCRLHVKTGTVFERLLNGCIDYCRVRGANCVTADSPVSAISLDDASQIFTRPLGHRRAIRLDGISPLITCCIL